MRKVYLSSDLTMHDAVTRSIVRYDVLEIVRHPSGVRCSIEVDGRVYRLELVPGPVCLPAHPYQLIPGDDLIAMRQEIVALRGDNDRMRSLLGEQE